MASKQQLMQADAMRDYAIAGCPLAVERPTRYAVEGAHDPTATHYFILDQLFSHYQFTPKSHLLDVGCGAGRALAHFAAQEFPGRATGVELDESLARYAQKWTSKHPQLNVIHGNVLALDLSRYTDFYLFNPFDSYVLQDFIAKLESDLATKRKPRPITLCHMSDNGESYYYLGRPGWTTIAQGEFHKHDGAPAYAYPQHFTIWRYDPSAP